MDESELYPFVSQWLHWYSNELQPHGGKFDKHVCDASTIDWAAGQWMRPDLILVTVRKRLFEAAPTLDVFGFEVKAVSPLSLQYVHQALAHGRIVDFATLVGPADAHNENGVPADVLEQAQRHGVGVAVFEDATDIHSYRFLARPRRMQPDPNLQDLFLNSVLVGAKREDVLAWLKAGAPS